MTFKPKGQEESCEMDDPIPGQNVSKLCGIENWQLFYGNFMEDQGWYQVGIQRSECGLLSKLCGCSCQINVESAFHVAC
jgi:hypothetical protein